MDNGNVAIICLGGNTLDAAARLSDAVAFLSGLGRLGRQSGTYRTAPEYAGETEPYLNEVMELSTPLTYEELQRRVKDYESGIRALNNVCDLVNLDIDIVCWNGEVVRPKDAVAAYFRIGLSKLDS